MRLPVHRTLVAAALASAVTLIGSLAPVPAGAQGPTVPEPSTTTVDGAAPATDEAPPADLPVGFLDGVPVGGDDPVELAADEALAADLGGPTDPGASAVPTVGTRAAAVTTRYFGSGAWNAIRSAATAATRPCTVTDDGLTALMVSPIFKESSAATTPSTAPSPMTLSRADEWTSGQYLDTSNLHANYGLYENRNPDTPYQRAYWHPGIGIWQYDSAGVGAPYTAVERMDVSIVGGDVARGMLARYCAASGDGFAKRRAAWSPWGAACTTTNAATNLCEIEFQAMTGSSPRFANISLVSGVSATGGVVARTCRIGTETLPCWYVDPDRSEGATGWKYNPSGGPDWRTRPTPLSTAFYVVKRNGREERHWLRADTGYPVDISATRLIGKNARPRSGTANVGSGLTWARTSTLCDVSATRGNCGGSGPGNPGGPEAPPGVNTSAVSVGGTYRSIALDVDGDGLDDVLWYAPGSAPDYLWRNRGNGSFTSTSVSVGGTYAYVLALDVDGDRRDDVFWYDPATATGHLWRSNGNGTFTSYAVAVGTGYQPLVLDIGGQGRDAVLLYAPGAQAEAWLSWNGNGLARSAAVQVGGTYQPFVGDFDGNGRDDVFWYAPGAAADYVWLHRVAGGYLDVPVSIGAAYRPLVGDFDGDRRDDIVWFQAGPTTEQIWWGAPEGRFSTGTFIVNNEYRPVVADLEGDGRDDVLWYAPGTSTDDLWTRWTSGRGRASAAVAWTAGYQPISGAFGPAGGGVLWYGPGSLADVLWWR